MTDIEKAHKLFAQHQAAAVWVTYIAKREMAMAGKAMALPEFLFGERKQETLGTVLDASGLIAIGSATLDPMSKTHCAKISEQGEGESETFHTLTRTYDFRVLIEEREFPAKLLMRDDDLNLAFVQANLSDIGPVHAVPLEIDSEPEILEEVLVLGRTGELLNREPKIAVSRITCKIVKPHRLYVCDDAEDGAPVFRLNGNFLGVASFQAQEKQDFEPCMPTTVVVPCETVRNLAEQVKRHAE
jgi:hypothetical protein